MAEPLTYVYAVVHRSAGGPPPGSQGFGGAELRRVEHGELAAVASDVAEDEFGESALRRNLEDVDWLNSTARTHNQGVEAVAEEAAVVPMGLATVFYGDDRVRACLAERAELFGELLDQVAGRTEWGVKAYAELTAAEEREPAGMAGTGRPGATYLRRVRERRDTAERAKQDAVRQAGEVHAALAGLAAQARTHRPQSRELAGYRGVMVLNGAYLVDGTRDEEFTGAVHELAREHTALRLELTGPWPPYSFATVQHEGET